MCDFTVHHKEASALAHPHNAINGQRGQFAAFVLKFDFVYFKIGEQFAARC